MPTFRTLSQITTSALQLAQMEQLGTGPDLVTSADMEDRANESLSSLWDMLITQGGQELLGLDTILTPVETATSSGIYVVRLPADFYKLLGLDQKGGGGQWERVRRLKQEDETRKDRFEGTRRRYRLNSLIDMRSVSEGPTLQLYPAPTATDEFQLRYIPEAPAFGATVPSPPESPGDAIALPNRFWQWVQLDLAVMLAMREEGDHRALQQRRDEVAARILRSVAATDYSEPKVIQDRRGALRRNARRRDRDPGYWR